MLVLLTWSAATFPLPVSLLPFSFSPSVAWAGGGPAPPPPTQGPSPTPTPLPPEVLEHYHPDHLGSTHVITNENGGCKQYLRYRAYGHVRLRSSCGSGGTVVNRHEFTGYETEPNTGLQYAGARHFDPATGMFLSHDPARQFANPYAYGPWDPLNGTDPDGAWFGLIAIAIAAAIGATVAGIQALANGASFGQSLKAAAIGGVIGGVTAAGLGVAGGMIAATESATLVLAYKLALVGSSGYGLADSIRSGQAAAAAAAAVGLAFGLGGLMEGGGGAQGANGAAQKRSEMLASIVEEGRQFDQQFSGTRVEIGYHELGSGKGTHTYLTATGRYSSAFPSGDPGGTSGKVSATLYQTSMQSESGWGLLTPEFGASDPTIYSDLGSPPTATQAFYTARSPVSVRSEMAAFAARIDAAGVVYNPISSNSNSYSFQLAENVLGFRPQPLLRAVGYGARLP